MRPTILLCLCTALVHTTNAQLSLLPQLGFENSRTSVAFNKQASFAPLGGKLSPQAAIRLDYKFKKGHGPFIGAATSRSLVTYNFSDPEAGTNVYTASRGGTQLRLEGGYQLSSKPIFLKKAAASNVSSGQYKKSGQRTCGKSMVRSGCGSKKTTAAAKPKDTRSWVRVQPSLGLAYIPGTPRSEIYTKSGAAQSAYVYNAGNWTTGFISGVGFEFGKASQSKFVVSLNYVKGISNLENRNLTTGTGNKATVTSIRSGASGWNVRMGIPISFARKQAVVKKPAAEKTNSPKRNCSEYKMQYRSKCTRSI